MFLDDLEKFTRKAKQRGIYPKIREIDGPSSDPIIKVNGNKFLTFSSNNYLGLAQNPEVVKVAEEASRQYGVGPASARLMSGNLDIYERLEEKISNFLGYEDAIVFSSGYMANIGTISSLMNPPYLNFFSFFKNFKKGLIISDELNHASIIDGCRLAKVEKEIFKHNDVNSLKNVLKARKSDNKLIIVDGVYSMDGDIAPLDKIVELAKQYGAAIMVDDAHATGVLGENGRGTFEYFGLRPQDIDIMMGTFVKAFGTVGGYVCASKEIVDYLKVSARSYVFSICISPACAAATIKAIDIIGQNESIRKKLWDNTNYLRNELNKLGFNTFKSETPIIPVLIGREDLGIKIEDELFNKGILAPCIRWPAVEKGKSRLRISVMTSHTEDQINKILGVLRSVGKKYNVI